MSWLAIANWLEMIGGSRPLPEHHRNRTRTAIARAAWWIFLLLIAIAFAGRNTKFVYVDF